MLSCVFSGRSVWPGFDTGRAESETTWSIGNCRYLAMILVMSYLVSAGAGEA